MITIITVLIGLEDQAMDAVLEHRRRYLTMKNGLWLLKAGLRETHIILLISSDYNG